MTGRRHLAWRRLEPLAKWKFSLCLNISHHHELSLSHNGPFPCWTDSFGLVREYSILLRVTCKQRKIISLLVARIHFARYSLSFYKGRWLNNFQFLVNWNNVSCSPKMFLFHVQSCFGEKQLRLHFPAPLAIKYVTRFHQWDMGRDNVCRIQAKSKWRSVFAFSKLTLFSPICQLDANTRVNSETTCWTWQSLGQPGSHSVAWLSRAHIELDSTVFQRWDFRLSPLQQLA